MFTPNLIKSAWKTRREAAKKYNCGIMDISWKECLEMAKEKQTPLEKCQDYYRVLLKKYKGRGLCPLEYMPLEPKSFMMHVFHELLKTKNNCGKILEVTTHDSRYRLEKVA